MKEWDGPFHIFANVTTAMDCLRLDDGRFHVYRSGQPAILLSGYGFILVKDPIISIFQKFCAKEADFKDAIVMQTVTGETWNGYYEIVPHEEISPDVINTIDDTGFKLWHFNRKALFISSAVRNELLNSNIEGISCLPGFLGFA